MFLRRAQLADLIPVAPATSNRWFPPTKSGLINCGVVIDVLNGHRRNGQPAVEKWVPHLLTASLYAERITAEGGAQVSPNTVRNWCVTAPHFRIENTILIDPDTFEKWMSEPETDGRVSAVDY